MSETHEGCPLERQECPFFQRDGFGGHTPAEALLLIWTWMIDSARPFFKRSDERWERLEGAVEELRSFKRTVVAVGTVLVLVGLANILADAFIAH